MPRSGSRVRIPSPAPITHNENAEKSAHSLRSSDDVLASIGLNKPRTVPTCPIDLGKRRAKRSRKVPDGPPDKKRSPASVGAERGADRRNSKSLSCKISSKRCPSTQESDRWLSVYDGRIRLGSIIGNGDKFSVILPNGALLGSFKTLRQASAAISTAQGGVR